jgi:hypothetical protein
MAGQPLTRLRHQALGSDDAEQRVLDLVASGLSLRKIALEFSGDGNGVSFEAGSLSRWLRETPSRTDRYREARQAAAEHPKFCVWGVTNFKGVVRCDGDAEAWERRLVVFDYAAPAPEVKIPNFAAVLMEAGKADIPLVPRMLSLAFESLSYEFTPAARYGAHDRACHRSDCPKGSNIEGGPSGHFAPADNPY